MKVEDLMTRAVHTSGPDDTLDDVVQVLQDHDCGCVPVVDEEERVIAMVTDRDVCMAALREASPLEEIPVSAAMSEGVHTCAPRDTIVTAEASMQRNRIRRVPVVDEEDRVIGLISIDDIAQEAVRQRRKRNKDVKSDDVCETLAAVCKPRFAEL